MPSSARVQRLARGWLVGLVATTVAAVSHSLAGGYRPGILSFGIAFVFAGLLGTAVIGRRPSLPRLIAAVGGAQLAFHLLFSTLGGGAAVTTSTRMPAMPGMASPLTVVPMSGHDHLADPGMWIAHAIAAALTILFLRHAELAVWGMLTRVLARVALRALPILGVVAPDPAPTRPGVPALVSRLLVSSASRRGPPLPSF